jgi:hypothetical protein
VTTNESLKTIVELSEEADYSEIFDYLAAFNAEARPETQFHYTMHLAMPQIKATSFRHSSSS